MYRFDWKTFDWHQTRCNCCDVVLFSSWSWSNRRSVHTVRARGLDAVSHACARTCWWRHDRDVTPVVRSSL